jgi:cell division protein FtsZ
MRAPVPEPSDKVHVLGVSPRGGGERPSSGAVGEAEAAPVMATPETMVGERGPFTEAPVAIENAAATMMLDSVEQNFASPAQSATLQEPVMEPTIEPMAPAEPVLAKDSPPVRKMVPVSTGGGFHAGITRVEKPEVVKTDAPAARNEFIAEPAVRPGQSPAGDLRKKADPMRVADMENAGKSAKKRGLSLFERMTGTGRGRSKETTTTAAAKAELAVDKTRSPARPVAEKRPSAPAPTPAPSGREPTFETLPQATQPMPEILSTEEDPLEIPAFLRRQAN